MSWPAIAVGFLLCVIPGLVLLWLRPSTSVKTKGLLSVLAVTLLWIAGSSETPAPIADADVSQAATNVEPAPATSSPDASTPDASTPAASSPAAAPESVSPSPSASPAPAESTSPSPTTSPTPEESASPTDPTPQPGKRAAAAAVEALPVKGRAPKTGYDRKQFGSGWIDVDRNGCDTRNDMLQRSLTDLTMSGPCKVLSGVLADPYTRREVRFVYGGASEVDVDHVVALSDAWQKGATPWPFARRVAFANDPLNLQPTDASANRAKGDGDAATWLPPNKAHRCTYVAQQIAVKKKYELWVTQAEKDAMLRVLSACPDQELPKPGPQPTLASNTGGQSPPDTTPATPKPTKSTPSTSDLDPRFGTCGEANDAGYGPYQQGTDPEYDWYQDRDHDGAVCER